MLCWANGGAEMQTLFDVLHKAGHHIVYWVGERDGKKIAPEGCIYHDHYEAWAGKPADAFVHERLDPPAADFLERLYRTESLALTMMNKRYGDAPVDERKQIYYDMLAYWNGVLEKVRPETILFPTIPHSIYDFLVYALAKAKGIPTLMFEDTLVGGRLLWFGDYERGSEALTSALVRNAHKHFTLEDIDVGLQNYYRSQTGDSQIQPAYMRAQKQASGGVGLLRHRAKIAWHSLFNGTLLSILALYLKRYFVRDLRDEHREFAQSADLNKPFVYFPLGFQPERTTAPQGDIFHDQILAAQTIAAALPSGWELYVKEHPSQWWLRGKAKFSSARYSGYYRRIAAIPHVRLIPTHTDSHTLIERSQTVATITGTAGWEALFRLKKPLIFGYPWYLAAPQLRRVRSVEDCRKAFAEIQREPHTKPEALLTLLKSLEESSILAYIGIIRTHLGEYYDVPMSVEESMNVIAKVVVEELHKAK